MTANDSQSYLGYLNISVDEYINTHHCSIGKKSGLLSITIFLAKFTPNWLKEIFVIDSVLETNLRTYKNKDLIEEKIIGSFYQKEFFSKL